MIYKKTLKSVHAVKFNLNKQLRYHIFHSLLIDCSNTFHKAFINILQLIDIRLWSLIAGLMIPPLPDTLQWHVISKVMSIYRAFEIYTFTLELNMKWKSST